MADAELARTTAATAGERERNPLLRGTYPPASLTPAERIELAGLIDRTGGPLADGGAGPGKQWETS